MSENVFFLPSLLIVWLVIELKIESHFLSDVGVTASQSLESGVAVNTMKYAASLVPDPL